MLDLIDYSPKTDLLSQEFASQAQVLLIAIAKSQSEYENLSLEINAMESAIEEFMAEYQTLIGKDLLELRKINSEIGFYEARLKAGAEISYFKAIGLRQNARNIFLNNEEQDEDKKLLKLEMKNFYRKLSGGGRPARNEAEFFNLINKFYNRKTADFPAISISTLEERPSDISCSELNNLETEYDSLHRLLDTLKIRKHRLVNSPEYMMMQKFSWAKVCGRDFAKEVTEAINLEIKERKKLLLKKRTEYIFLAAADAEEKASA